MQEYHNIPLIDADAGIRRFGGKKELFEKFLFKFPEDRNYIQLKEALKTCDYELAFHYAHALKGVSGNLSLQCLYQAVCGLVEQMRSNNYNDLDVFMDTIDAIYDATLDAIRQI
ncbi:MAG: Hpt domain-containing protein [Hungatella sp.]